MCFAYFSNTVNQNSKVFNKSTPYSRILTTIWFKTSLLFCMWPALLE
ncbi:hypothetical protein TELCIR_13988 [Teladorsagia circumcincta]|uniref:Uncharacterized protein n=1 Tax=Teladorsagia circumcincta TaxID=45464 RepID=A0A2G9U290_TELCI|nr:hypothetical protein TELCIR_13988 [Teladorsagia circumcincta]